MIVQCVQCDTRFQLDESRVPITGVRVRCSRCKESFFLAHPSASQEEVVHGIAEEVVSGGSPPVPDGTQDLGASSEMLDAVAETLAEPDSTLGEDVLEAAFDTDVGPVLGAVSEKEDWQFNDDVPEVEVAQVEAAPAEAMSLAEAEMPVEASAEVDPGSAFGSVDDFSSLIEEVAESDAAGSALPDSGLEIEAEAALGDSSGLELAGDSPANTEESDVEPGQPEELGDPEDWNFFSDAPSSGYQPPPVATSPTPGDSSSHQTAADDLNEASEEEMEYERGSASAGWAGEAGSLVGRGMGWLATISLVGFGLFHGIYLGEVTDPEPAAPIAIGSLVVEGLAPSWIDNQYQGRILAIRGRLFNPTRQRVVQREAIFVGLLDGGGNALAVPPVRAALSLSEQAIRELPAERLRIAQARAADDLVRSTLAPGQSLPFLALIEEVPPEAEAFALVTGPAWE